MRPTIRTRIESWLVSRILEVFPSKKAEENNTNHSSICQERVQQHLAVVAYHKPAVHTYRRLHMHKFVIDIVKADCIVDGFLKAAIRQGLFKV